MKTNKKPKALVFSLGLAALLPPTLTATAQYGDRGMWDNSIESPYDMGNLGAFDWADFTDLFDQISQSGATDERFSEFRLFDFSNLGDRSSESFTINTEDFGAPLGSESFTINTEDFGAPLGSGIALLVGAGLGYAALKRRKEDEQ